MIGLILLTEIYLNSDILKSIISWGCQNMPQQSVRITQWSMNLKVTSNICRRSSRIRHHFGCPSRMNNYYGCQFWRITWYWCVPYAQSRTQPIYSLKITSGLNFFLNPQHANRLFFLIRAIFMHINYIDINYRSRGPVRKKLKFKVGL